MSGLYPLKLKYAASTAIWGGERLKKEWGKQSELSPLAETWELSVRGDGMMSYIENGELAGLTLKEYIETVGNSCVSDTYDGGRFPLLIKFIDAETDLSVQVHPDDKYARETANDSGKTEMWYIVDAKDGAEIVCGLADGVSRENFFDAVKKNEYSRVLKRVKVRRGESYFIPAGLAHAICGGILIAEIQQNSDLTYRIYDYDRVGADGKKRQLHVQEALDVVRPFREDEIDAVRYENGGKDDPECLAGSKYFSVFKITLDGKRELFAAKESFHCLLCVGGETEIECCGHRISVSRGDCIFVPAGTGAYSIVGKAELLLSRL